MDNRTILVLQGPSGTPQELSPLANAVTAIGGRLTVLHVGQIPEIPTYAFDAYSLPASWDESRREMADQLKAQAAKTATYLANVGVPVETDVIFDTTVDLGYRIVPHTYCADVAVLTNDLREDAEAFNSLCHGIIFDSPVPLILNPTESALTPKHVTVAWSESLPSTRAVHAALPLLKAAKTVTLTVIDPVQGKDDTSLAVAAWLSHHGCKVNVEKTPSAGLPVADVLLRCAVEDGADLIVMGAYGHTRMRQRLFGGTTRTVIAQTKQAVFLTH